MANTDLLDQATQASGFKKLSLFARLSGPGWVQAAVTLGGGSLAGSLYLGVVAGYELLWLQPLAMLCGIIMLMALNQVTLNRKDYPFTQVKKTISPLLAWGWLIATVVANVVFCSAQNMLGIATIRQNLGASGVNEFVIAGVLSVVAFGSVYLYSKGSKFAARFEAVLKILVAIVILCFFGAAGYLLMNGQADLGAVLKGLVPNPQALFNPAESLKPMIDATSNPDWWTEFISGNQRDRIITAFGTAVGINMTFLLPYSVRRKGWSKKHTELSKYDLVLALLIPYSIATCLLVIVSASQFHGKTGDVLDRDMKPVAGYESNYYKVLGERLNQEEGGPFEAEEVADLGPALLTEADQQLAASLTNRDAGQLSKTLEPILGSNGANLIFGIGILAMAVSTMMVHMLMNGYAISQGVNKPGESPPFVLGAMIPGALALFAPIVWTGDAKTALQVPAAIIATALLPIAYLSILLLINRTQSDEKRPAVWHNGLLVLVLGIASFGSYWSLAGRGDEGRIGMAVMVILAMFGILGFLRQSRESRSEE